MSDIPSDIMVWVRIEDKRTEYADENKARLSAVEYCVSHKYASVLFYDSMGSTSPFGVMLCFEKEDRPVWFTLIDCDDRFPDTGCSEGPYSIDDDGSIN